MKDTRHLKLVAIGTSNWDYYLKEGVEKRQRSLCPTDIVEVPYRYICYVAKESAKGCSSGIFGDIKHFVRQYMAHKDYSLTELGEELVREYRYPKRAA